MKKSFLFMLCSFILLPICADAGCGFNHIEFQFKQDPNDDEFIYDVSSDYEYAEQQYAKGNKSFDLNNTMWECDNEQGCSNGTYLLAPAGHSWDGKSNMPERLYICDTTGLNNQWYSLWDTSSIPACDPNITISYKLDVFNNNSKQFYVQNRRVCYIDNSKRCSTKFGTIPVGMKYSGVATKQDCLDSGAKILEDKGLEFDMVCRAGPTLVCKATKCPSGYTPNGSTGKCDPTDNNNDNNNNGGGGGGTGTNSCEQTRCNGLSGDKYNECVACCHVSSSVANWNSSACICAQNPDSNKFVPNSNPRSGGVCVPQQSGGTPPPVEPEPAPEPAYICDPAKIAQIRGWQIQYASSTTISTQIMTIIQYCEGKPTENVFIAMYNQLLALINQENAAAQLTQQQNASRRRIEGAISDIDSVVSTLDRSKWKNAEGGFNTSRLLSDSIAGVVLGTAGGLITSHVVKKNQVEGGFEDIQCTVGGQVVSGWGDEFQVGIQ